MSTTNTSNGGPQAENLYHVLLNTSHIQKDVNSEVEKLRVCGTYTDLAAAKAAAHRALFEAGYEREWFKEFYTNPQDFAAHHLKRRTVGEGLCVFAKAGDGTVFRASVATTPNQGGFQASGDDHKVHLDLYHVVQTVVLYDEDDTGETRQAIVEGSFRQYEEARKLASQVLLSAEDGVTKKSFAQYDEAEGQDRDCGYGDNVVVHAVGQNGENILVSVLKGQELESVRLAEAAMRIRS